MARCDLCRGRGVVLRPVRVPTSVLAPTDLEVRVEIEEIQCPNCRGARPLPAGTARVDGLDWSVYRYARHHMGVGRWEALGAAQCAALGIVPHPAGAMPDVRRACEIAVVEYYQQQLHLEYLGVKALSLSPPVEERKWMEGF